MITEKAFPEDEAVTTITVDVVIFEPYLAVGQIVASDALIQLQTLAEIPAEMEVAESELKWRATVGGHGPKGVAVRTSQRLHVRNSEATLHNVHVYASENRVFNIGQPFHGVESRRTFAAPEIGIESVMSTGGCRDPSPYSIMAISV